MHEDDTVQLLEECSAGIQMAVKSMEGVLPSINDSTLRERLNDCLDEHRMLGDETHKELQKCGGDEKKPNPVAAGMSWLRTNVQLSWNKSSASAADLLTDGCNMGIKSLQQYKNQYAAAKAPAQHLVDRIIDSEQRLADDLKAYL